MPFYPRKKQFRKRYVKKSSLSTLARGGRKTAIQKLATAVKTIQRKIRKQTDVINFQQVTNASTISAGSPIQLALSNYQSYNPIFGAGPDDYTGNKMIHKAFGMSCRVSLESEVDETSTIAFTAFLVRLKDSMAPFVNFNDSTLSLTDGEHYVTLSGSLAPNASPSIGDVMLNKKYFQIIKYKRFTLSNYGKALGESAAQTQYGTDMEWYWKVKPNLAIQNPNGDWAKMACPKDCGNAYYYLLFNNNSSLDLEAPFMATNVVHTVQPIN